MQVMHLNRLIIMSLSLLLMLASAGLAAKITVYEPAIDQVRFQGQIMAVSADHDSFELAERQVCLVDFSRGGRRYLTSILRLDGSALEPADLRPGDWVAVKGVVLADKRIGAQVIYLLPHQLSRAEAQAYPILLSEPVWGLPAEQP